MAHTTLTNADTSPVQLLMDFRYTTMFKGNATLLLVPLRPSQIHAAVMPICLLLLVGRRSQTSHILGYSSDGFLALSALPPPMFSPCGGCRICSTFACCSRDTPVVYTLKLLLYLLAAVVGFVPLMLITLYIFRLLAYSTFQLTLPL